MKNRRKPMRPTNDFLKMNKPRSYRLSAQERNLVDYKNPKELLRCTSNRGKIMASRITGMTAKQQRELKQSIKRSRYLALLPYVSLEG